MFTGIVEELGRVVAVERLGDSARLRLRASTVVEDAAHGSSIAVNGTCLTVVEFDGEGFTADVMAETLRRSNIATLAPGDVVNLERPMALGGRLGGHLVQGHVDGTAEVLAREPGERWETVTFTLPPQLARYVVEKGSIAVDGVSLTVVEAGRDRFSVGLIPTTLDLTTLGRRQPGDLVNLEVDLLAKHVERLLAHGAQVPSGRPEGAVFEGVNVR
ncbi:riboflavin synthase [Streptomyces sp. 3MP-14]|uniref:Riboflavin synthase n=1 Tax=Streptomyces mimosae TaxID=2586635 RepID=A0A5N6A5G5_9ACTN|nr:MULTISPECIES: riboflavin synthase [Streptomyces]KAB8162638.1 riboflavin synthase [Streptomyces mimosae]KAB8174465.1 riboflavin synthase [Streptomyces sp. 3MP-14]